MKIDDEVLSEECMSMHANIQICVAGEKQGL